MGQSGMRVARPGVASRAMVQTIYRFKTDKVQVPDEYNPI